MIRALDLYFCYHTDMPFVLSGMDFTIQEGEWLAVIGPNGSGKSTLARCLNGLLLPTSGTVEVDGLLTRDEDKLWQIREKVAFVFQNPDNQLIATSVEDDVAFGPENLGLPRLEITRRVEEALTYLHLQEKRTAAPHLLSGGEKQRVALAGALAMASRYLVLDEPTSMLDPLMRVQMIASLQEMRRSFGLGIVYLTNIMEEVLLADRVLVLSEGKIVKDTTPAALFAAGADLDALGLGQPEICRIASALAEDGYEELRGICDLTQLVEKLCALS